MEVLKSVLPIYITLLLCTANGYFMCNYRVSVKKSIFWYAVVTLFCFVLNSYILIQFGYDTLQKVMLFSVAFPYLILFFFISRDKLSHTFFNFWLWITIYIVITNCSKFINEITFDSYTFETILRIVLLILYFVVYQKYLRKKHWMFMETLDISWWIYSLLPMVFSILIVLNKNFSPAIGDFDYNYLVIFTILALMLLVYALVIYIHKTSVDSQNKELLNQSMKDQMVLQKKQYQYYLQNIEKERIFRHDQRHRNSVLLKVLENGDIETAKEIINKEQAEVETISVPIFCDNPIINAVFAEYYENAEKKRLHFSVKLHLPDKLTCDETELCVILSNLLENSLAAAKSYISVESKYLNGKLLFNIKNDYTGEVKKNSKGYYISTKHSGEALGLKSVEAMLKPYGGMLIVEDDNNIFNVFISLNN